MFGYVNIDKDKLSDGERGLWQTFMCGLCFSSKKFFKNKARLVINNDINFFNVLFHSFNNVDVEIMKSRCFAHPVKKRTIVTPTSITDSLAVSNVLLMHYNLYDDVVDNGSLKKRLAYSAFKSEYKRAKILSPELDSVVSTYYEALRMLEKSGNAVLDSVCHPFSELTRQFAKITLGDSYNDTVGDLCYNVGKWIYLIDALDDIKQDLSKGEYNPFIDYYKGTDISFVADKMDEITYLMYAVLNKIAMCYNDLNLSKYICLLKNVIFDAMRSKTKEILDTYSNRSKEQ